MKALIYSQQYTLEKKAFMTTTVLAGLWSSRSEDINRPQSGLPKSNIPVKEILTQKRKKYRTAWPLV
eukprot:TRINITY_DN727_c0_g1_i1.p1 TRINITY_DN727_c0_g1~~TRINITY_DN727_c0_g1_i1.p1  ORF type:complete len:67 (-),score=16.67 TRINITY_DN727_c0_g1_i1:27-227(-)